MSSERAALPNASQAKGTGGSPSLSIVSSIRRAVSVSCRTVSTRVTDGASRCAVMRSTNRVGMSLAAAMSSSSLREAMISRRSAKGLRDSRLMRLLAERMPTTSPSPSTTGMWFTPAVIIAMLASGARTSAPMVWTGADMIAVTGACRDTPPTTTLSRRSTSVTMPTMPLPSGDRTMMAERFSRIMISAASRAVVVAAQKSGLLRVTEVTGMRAYVRHGTKRAGRLEQAFARVGRHPLHPGRAAEQAERHVAGDAVQQRVFARAHRELRREAGEQRRVPDDLAGRDHRNVRVLVDELERAQADHVELRPGWAPLDEDRLTSRHGALADGRRHPVELLRRQTLEGRDAGQEARAIGDAGRVGGRCHLSSPI